MTTESQSLTQRWLRQNLQPYTHQDRVYADVDAVLTRFPALRPKSDIYTYDDGRTHLLLCIHGLLPISFRHASYNIPIAIWVTREYPRQPPITYVVPTNDMLVRPGKYVDVSGKCSLDYLQHWERKSEGCTLPALLEAMQEQFSREPPVYAKPKNTEPPSTPVVSQNYPGRPAPPLPPVISHSAPAQPTQLDRPLLPPKPGPSSMHHVASASSDPPIQPHPPAQIAGPSPPRTEPLLPPPPPLDTILPQYGSSPPVPPNYRRSSKDLSLTHSHGPTSVGAGPPPNAPWSAPQPHNNAPPTISPPPSQGPSYFTSPPISHRYHSQFPHLPPPPIPEIKPPLIPAPNLLDEDSSDFSASSDQAPSSAPPPPRPPNPELLHLHTRVYQKLTSELGSLSQAMSLDAERLRAHQTDLLAGAPAIRDEMARLEAVRDVCRNVASRVKGTVEQAERNIAELRRKGDPEVDELVCSTTIVHNQLINLVAEDNAIEDAIYHLHRALSTGRIDLERFLRTTRVLAEEQFMKRALIEKIQAGMPMGMTMSMGPAWS